MSWPPRPWLVACAVAVIGVLVFLPAISGGWIYDDHLLIPDNQYVHSLHWWPRWFVTDFWDIGDEFARLGARIAYWRPAITTTYAIDWKLGGGTPLMFHLTNFAWHGAVGGLTFVVMRRWLGGALWPAVIAALVFVVHPTKGESVAWIAGRTDVVCTAAMLLATQGVARRLAGQRFGIHLELGGTLLAYMCKEQAIVLPVFVMVEAWVAADRPALDLRVVLRMARAALPQLAIAIAYMLVRKLVMPIAAVNLDSSGQPIADHAQAVLETLGRFFTLSAVPHDLSIQHGLVRVAGGKQVHDAMYMVIGAVGVAGLAAAAWFARKRLPAITIGIGVFALTVAPTSNVVNTQMKTLVSERFLYLPMFGLAFALGALIARWPRRAVYVASALAIVALSIQTLRRAADYSDEETFWARELALHPESSEARRRRVSSAIAHKQYRAALVETLEMMRTSSQPEDLPAASDIAQLTSDLTPDHDRAALETIDSFSGDLIAAKPPAAELKLPTLTFRIPTTTKRYRMYLDAYALRLLGLRSSIRSRLGDDQGAIQLAQDGIDRCAHCPSTVTAASLALARAGRYDDAEAVLASARGHVTDDTLDGMHGMLQKGRVERDRAATLAGPAQLQARAAELAALELWGRAFDTLAPFKEQIKQAPKFVVGFAELAVRAGEPQIAREVLAGIQPPADVERMIAGWTRTMGWVE